MKNNAFNSKMVLIAGLCLAPITLVLGDASGDLLFYKAMAKTKHHTQHQIAKVCVSDPLLDFQSLLKANKKETVCRLHNH